MGSNSIVSFKVYGCLYFALYTSSCTLVSGIKFIFIFKSKSAFGVKGVELYNGLSIMDQNTNCSGATQKVTPKHDRKRENIAG